MEMQNIAPKLVAKKNISIYSMKTFKAKNVTHMLIRLTLLILKYQNKRYRLLKMLAIQNSAA